MVSQNKHEGESEAAKTMSSSKQVELLKTPVVLVRSDIIDTSHIVDYDDEDEDDEEKAFIEDDIPFTFKETVKSLESVEWKKSMDEEMKSLYKNET
ncbi:hypothetical protein L3X38_036678 [Prunus dulcis]|uniref:Uncharacterized protein n=1 Tax=Prunus dulcis TaxID=3755 RepID=A0AAD4YPN2_PRUDU|nr:hypothetical protein L3X38_036678 [Prunus dulcis]